MSEEQVEALEEEFQSKPRIKLAIKNAFGMSCKF
jgi:hypothetical protein